MIRETRLMSISMTPFQVKKANGKAIENQIINFINLYYVVRIDIDTQYLLPITTN